jgi:hypothetical protein
MPKKGTNETQAEQSARFRAEVERMIAAGELNPIEADEAFERLFGKSVNSSQASGQAPP